MTKKRKAPAPSTTMAELVTELFNLHRHPDGREYTHKEVEAGITRAAGRKLIDASYLSKLRTGTIKNPSAGAIEALCYFFPVEVNYFFPDLANFHNQSAGSLANEVILALRKRGGDPVALRKQLQTMIKLLTIEEED